MADMYNEINETAGRSETMSETNGIVTLVVTFFVLAAIACTCTLIGGMVPLAI